MAKRQVYLAYTTSETFKTPHLLRIYAKSSYQKAYNWLADIAERQSQKYPFIGSGNVCVMVENQGNGQRWWLERHDVE